MERQGAGNSVGRVTTLGITQGIAGLGVGQLGNGADITGGDAVRVGLLLAEDSQQFAQRSGSPVRAFTGVHTGGQLAGDDL